MPLRKPITPAILFAVLATVAVAAPLFQQGLFADGLLYQTVALNLYRGEAGFWSMKFSQTSMHPFCEQPPLYFAAVAGWCSVFGASFLSGKIFTLVLFACTLFLVAAIARRIAGGAPVFAPLLALLCIPVFQWTFINQVIETLVTPLALLGCLIVVLYSGHLRCWYSAPFFAICVTLLFFTKGVQSCFIAAMPVWWLLVFRQGKFVWFTAVAYALIAAMLLAVFTVYQPASEWLDCYWQKRIVATFSNVGATASWRGEIIARIFTELLVPAVLACIAVISARGRRVAGAGRLALVFLLTALSGSVPLAATLEQRGFYLAPSFPFFVLAAVAWLREPVTAAVGRLVAFLSRDGFKKAAVILAAGSVIYLAYSPSMYKRDKTLHSDLMVILPHLSQGDTVSVSREIWNDLPLQAWLYMRARVSADDSGARHRYYIFHVSQAGAPPEGYEPVGLKTNEYRLYRRNDR